MFVMCASELLHVCHLCLRASTCLSCVPQSPYMFVMCASELLHVCHVSLQYLCHARFSRTHTSTYRVHVQSFYVVTHTSATRLHTYPFFPIHILLTVDTSRLFKPTPTSYPTHQCTSALKSRKRMMLHLKTCC
jgi:hypothetical protein